MNPGPFTTPQMATILELPMRKVLSFIERGFISPSIQEASGHGSRRLWSYEDLIRCAAVKFLLNALSVDFMRVLSEHLRSDHWFKLDKAWGIDLSSPAATVAGIPSVILLDKAGDLYNTKWKDGPPPTGLIVDFRSICACVKERLSHVRLDE